MDRTFKAASFQSLRIHQIGWWGVVCGVCCLLAGCNVTAPMAPATPPPAITTQAEAALFTGHATNEAAVTALILAEREAAIAHNLPLLAQLWAADARIADGRNSATTSDDYIWQGRAAILDRYQVAVFPFDLPALAHLDAGAVITIIEDRATVQHGNDRWQLTKVNDRWWLTDLQYNYPP